MVVVNLAVISIKKGIKFTCQMHVFCLYFQRGHQITIKVHTSS